MKYLFLVILILFSLVSVSFSDTGLMMVDKHKLRYLSFPGAQLEGAPLELLSDWTLEFGTSPSPTGFKEEGRVLTMFDCTAVESYLSYKKTYGVNGYVEGTFIYTSTLSNLYSLPLSVRMIDANNLVGLRMNSERYEVVERFNSTWATLTQIDNPAVGDRVRLSIEDQDLEVFVNGVSVWTGTTQLPSNPGYFGLSTHTWSAGDNTPYIRDFTADVFITGCPDGKDTLIAYAEANMFDCKDGLLEYEPTYTETPCMTSADTPHGTVTDNIHYNDGTYNLIGWKGMTCSANDAYDCWCTPTPTDTADIPVWLDWREPAAKSMTPTKFRITPRAGMGAPWYPDNNPKEIGLNIIKVDGSEVEVFRQEIPDWTDSNAREWDVTTTEKGIGVRLYIYRTLLYDSGGDFHTCVADFKVWGVE